MEDPLFTCWSEILSCLLLSTHWGAPGSACRASPPGEAFSQSAEKLAKWAVAHFWRLSLRLHKKVAEFPPVFITVLIDIHRPSLHPGPSVEGGDTFAVGGHYAQPRYPFISQDPPGERDTPVSQR